MSSKDTKGDMMAFVKFGHQISVVSLNQFDGYDQWMKVLLGIAPCPVDVVLMADKALSDRSQGISIKDQNSFLEAMKVLESKVVEGIRVQNEVLRIVLYPIEAKPRQDTSSSDANKHLPLRRLVPEKKAVDTKHAVENAEIIKTKENNYLRKMAEDEQMRLLMESTHVTCNEVVTPPQWAIEMKNELRDMIDSRFNELNKCFDEKLSFLGDQMKESMMASLTTLSTFSRPEENLSLSSATSSIIVLGSQSSKPTVECSSLTSEMIQHSIATNEPSFDVVADHEQESSDMDDSVVLVSQAESSHVEIQTVDGNSDNSVDIVTVEQVQSVQLQNDDNISDSGSVVYVDTDDGEDEEDAFTNLRSWASGGIPSSLSASQTSALSLKQMQESMNESVSSFHSTISATRDAPMEAELQETVVYTTYPSTSTQIDMQNEALEFDNQQEVFHESVVENAVEQPQVQEDVGRPIPINGSAQLPININAMRAVDEQNLFSPNSDFGTKLMSAASAIANTFLSSMESFSKVMSEFEARQLAQQQARASQQQAAEAERAHVQMEAMNAGTMGMPIVDAPAIVPEVVVPTAPEVPDRGRGPRGPPPSTGPYMSWEQMTWYFNEYGMPDMIKASWVNDRLTIDQFNTHVMQHFDQLEGFM